MKADILLRRTVNPSVRPKWTQAEPIHGASYPMPRPGGESDKLGNRYEAIWTVSVLLELAAGRYESVVVEPAGDDSTGIEFVVRHSDGTREFHSAKRQHAGSEWTLAALTRCSESGRSILGDLAEKLILDENAHCLFVSSTGANELRELTERAKRRLNASEFEDELKSSIQLLKAYTGKFLPLVSKDAELAFAVLRRIVVRIMDEGSLEKLVDQQVSSLVYRPDLQSYRESDVRLLLGDYVILNLGNAIHRDAIWEFLVDRGFAKRDWASDKTVQTAVRDGNRSYSRSIESELINGTLLTRAESKALLEEIRRPNGHRIILVSAQAGLGKSCVMVQALRALVDEGTPVLIVRMDRHGEARTTRDIAIQMMLPRSPAVVLAGLANGGPSVLMIDQLDATSQVSGRYPHLWEVFDTLCTEAEVYPNMRIVLACREFDLQHDHRLRRITQNNASHIIKVDRLTNDDVNAAMISAGGTPDALSATQRELLRIPLHLYLFLGSFDQQDQSKDFRTIGDLFEQFWRYKQRKVNERLGRPSEWSKVLDRLCDVMSSQLTLYAPEAALDNWLDTVDAMLTEHVLIRDGRQIRFFHESFFDYAFGRYFLRSGKQLLPFLMESEQHLFRRAQVRQILTFLRDDHPKSYLIQLNELLTSSAIRFHIQHSVFAWIGSLQQPRREEWEVVRPFLENVQLERHVLPQFRHSLPWFDLIDGQGMISKWLDSADEESVNRAMWFLMLNVVRTTRSARGARLLAPYRGRSDEWTRRLVGFYRFGGVAGSEESKELFLDLIGDGAFDARNDNRHERWWSCLRDTVKESALFALEALCRWIDSRIRSLLKNGEDPFFDTEDEQEGARLIRDIADAIPMEYSAAIFPRVVEVVKASLNEPSNGLVCDRVWRSRTNARFGSVREAVLDALCCSMEWVSQEHPEVLVKLFPVPPVSDWRTVAVLFLRAWSANPERFAGPCLEFLSTDVRRLDIGHDCWSGGGTGYAAVTREAISCCIAHADCAEKMRLECAVLGFSPPDEHVKHQGFHEWLLLEAMGSDNLSERGQRRLQELRARFSGHDARIPPRYHDVGLSMVGSPIPSEDARMFSDDQWLKAMRRYDYGWDESGRRAEEDARGTAVELSRVLQPLVREQRARFASLALRMEDSVRQEYFDAILEGICSTANLSKEERRLDDEAFAQLDTDLILGVVHRLHDLPGRPCGRAISDAFVRLANRVIPPDEFEILRYYAIDDADPSAEEWRSHNDDLDWAVEHAHFYGYNSVRGHAARAIESLLFADYTRSCELLPILDQMVCDSSIAVRTCVIEALLPVLKHNREKAVQMFVKLCQCETSIVGTETFEDFVRYASYTHYSDLRANLLAGLESGSVAVQSAAARQICIAGLSDELAAGDAARIRTGTDAMRIAAAQVYSRNLSNASVGDLCEEHVRRYFHDSSRKVRDTASECFQHIDDENLAKFIPVIGEYIGSPAFPTRHDILLRRLEEAACLLPDLIIQLAEAFIRAVGTDAGDVSTAASFDAPTVSKLVIRLYSQSSDEDVRSRCLDLIDAMERLGFYGMESQLSEHDR